MDGTLLDEGAHPRVPEIKEDDPHTAIMASGKDLLLCMALVCFRFMASEGHSVSNRIFSSNLSVIE
jgi:hypothetical protein